MCKNWPDSLRVNGATGGLIGDTAMICGGRADSYMGDECYSLTSEKATLVTHMLVWRENAASIVFNENILWVTGGYGPSGFLASTEYVTMTGTMPGPDLPKDLSNHAMVAINSTCSMVIGGSYSWSTHYFDHSEHDWINGPSLIKLRSGHAAGIVTDEMTDENFVAVTGGYGQAGQLSEILQDGNWVQGKINGPALVNLGQMGKFQMPHMISGLRPFI